MDKDTLKAIEIITEFLDWILHYLSYETDTKGTWQLANKLTELDKIINDNKEK